MPPNNIYSQPPSSPITQPPPPQNAAPPVAAAYQQAKPSRANDVSMISFGLVVFCFFIPYAKILILPLIVVGTIAAAKTGTIHRNTIKEKPSFIIRVFKVIAIIGLIIAGLFVAGIGLLMLALSQGGGF